MKTLRQKETSCQISKIEIKISLELQSIKNQFLKLQICIFYYSYQLKCCTTFRGFISVLLIDNQALTNINKFYIKKLPKQKKTKPAKLNKTVVVVSWLFRFKLRQFRMNLCKLNSNSQHKDFPQRNSRKIFTQTFRQSSDFCF